jgi:hypothetical protein
VQDQGAGGDAMGTVGHGASVARAGWFVHMAGGMVGRSVWGELSLPSATKLR